MTTFDQLNLVEPILKALKAEGYVTPTPIQQQAIPILLQGKDLLGCAQTGTGKTAAFAIPILQLLYKQAQNHQEQKRKIKALILTPTRELAIQIEESFTSYGRNTGLRQTVIFGGVSQHAQVDRLNRGIDILIATPGRLLDLMQQGYVHLNELQFFVLDEADRMLDMGFVNDVKKVIAKLPKKRHSLFFSATMPPVIQSLADSILHQPTKVEVTPVSSTADTIQQSLFYVSKGDKKRLLIHLLETEKMNSVLVFTRTKHGADRVVKDLDKAGIRAAAIHGNKSQNARQAALGDFKSGKIKVLLATDIASRGIGRTGRAGFNGIAFSFCEEEEFGELKDIQKLIGKKIPVVETHPFPLDTRYTESVPVQAKPKKQIPPHNRPPANKPAHKPKRHWRGRD
jgi:ATP-dependent RNA helicase RhlE